MKRYLLSGLILLWTLPLFAQKKLPAGFCISSQEQQLFELINRLRNDYGKKSVKLSASLCYVAKTHVKDLLKNRPDTSICNLSSWSDKGEWTPCCYNTYLPQPMCMKKKPKELTPYPYYGYETVTYFEDLVHLDSVAALWGNTKSILDFLFAKGAWKQKKWSVVGIGMNEHYVSVWFGQKPDSQKTPEVCKGEPVKAKQPVAVNNKTSYYYIIFASFTNRADAREAVRRAKKNGFKDAGILQKGDRVRVYLYKVSSLKEATYYKNKLSPTYRDAWILKN